MKSAPLSNLKLYALGPVVTALLGIITLPITTWFFSKEAVGSLVMFQVFLNLSCVVVGLGLFQGYVRDYHETKDKEGLFLDSLIPSLLFTVFIIIVHWFVYKWNGFSLSGYLFNLSGYWLDLLVILAVCFLAINNLIMHVFRMEERAMIYSISLIAPRFFFLLFMFLFLVLISRTFSALFKAHILAIISTFLLSLYCLIAKLKTSRLKATLNVMHIKRLLRYSLPLMFGSLAFWLVKVIDRFFLNHYFSLEDVAIYSIAVTVAGAFNILSSFISSIWHPTLFKWVSEGIKIDKLNSVIGLTVSTCVILFSFVGVFSPAITLFFPVGYEDLPFLIVICSLCPILFIISETTVVGIAVSKKTNYSLWLSIVTLMFCILSNMILVPYKGVDGAAISSVLTFFLYFVFRTYASKTLWLDFNTRYAFASTVIMSLLSCFYLLFGKEIEHLNWVFLCLLLLPILYSGEGSRIVIFLKSKEL